MNFDSAKKEEIRQLMLKLRELFAPAKFFTYEADPQKRYELEKTLADPFHQLYAICEELDPHLPYPDKELERSLLPTLTFTQCCMYLLYYMRLLVRQLFRRILRLPLERRERLRHEAGAADGNGDAFPLRAVGILIEGVHDALAEIGNSCHILHRFGRQAEHKVQLNRTPSCLKGFSGRAENLLLGDVLVDRIAKALRSCFGGKGQACAAEHAQALG